MKNLDIWIITLIIAIVLIVGIFYYGIIGAVVNAIAFIISLTIIFLALILVIIFSQQDNKNKIPSFGKPKIEIGSEGLFSGKKPKNVDKKNSSKKSKEVRKE